MNIFLKAIYAIRDAFTLTDSAGWHDVRTSSRSGSAVTGDSILQLAAGWACVNLIAGTGGSLPLMVYRNDKNGARIVARDHPLYYLLHDSPNRDQTAVDFWEFVFASLELRGDAFAHKQRIGSRLVGLVPVRPDIVTVRRVENGDLFYRWTDGGHAYDLPSADVLHIRGFGGSPLGGLSTLTYGRNTFGLAQDIEGAASSTFVNGMRPSGVLTVDKILNNETRAATKQVLAEAFGGSMNAGLPMVLEGGTKWEQISIKPEDAQMLQSRSFSVEEICRFFGVPPIMVGHGEKTSSWGTGVAEVTQGFIKYTMRRRLKRIEQALAKQLLTPVDRAAGVTIEFNLEGLLRGDSAGRAAFYTAGLQNGWMTINEVRGLENLPPVAGGETPRMQMQNVPITEAGKLPAGAAA